MEPKWYDPVAASKKEKLHCPVCKAQLGTRYKEELITFHCNECLAEFKWYPHEDKPVAELDTTKRHKHCGCGSCTQ